MDKVGPRGFFVTALTLGIFAGSAASAQVISLEEVARKHKTTKDRLEHALKHDKSLKLGKGGEIEVSESLPQQITYSDAGFGNNPAASGIPASQTFFLHSRPGATAKLYLNFKGKTVSNTYWNQKYTGGSSFNATPYSMDGDPAFNDQELAEIRATWLAMAEDYAAFNVDVTTEAPAQRPSSRYLELLFTANYQWLPDLAGGICTMGGFNGGDSVNVCFVFPDRLGNTGKNMAEAGSHEAGHGFGLWHWGVFNGSTEVYSYYSGASDHVWAPLMGVGYYAAVTTWSRGEYPNAGTSLGAGQTQDDVATIHQSVGSVPADDHGSSLATATRLSSASGLIDFLGILGQGGDTDVFRIDSGTGDLSVQVVPAAFNPNADFRLRILSASGGILAESNPNAVAEASGLLYNVPAGAYYLEVTSVGYGDPYAGGYPAYGSLGRYQLKVRYAPSGTVSPSPSPTPVNTPTPTPQPSPTPVMTPTPTPQPSPTPVNPDNSLSVSLVEPISRTVQKNSTQFRVSAQTQTEVGLRSIQFRANGSTFCSVTASGTAGSGIYGCAYRTKKNASGSVTFEAVVTNLDGKVARSTAVTVSIR